MGSPWIHPIFARYRFVRHRLVRYRCKFHPRKHFFWPSKRLRDQHKCLLGLLLHFVMRLLSFIALPLYIPFAVLTLVLLVFCCMSDLFAYFIKVTYSKPLRLFYLLGKSKLCFASSLLSIYYHFYFTIKWNWVFPSHISK